MSDRDEATLFIRSLCALALLAGLAGTARAEVIQPFSCWQIKGPAPSLLFNVPAFQLRKPGRVLLICPVRDSMSGFRIRYHDDDGILGGSSVRVSLTQTVFFNDAELSRGPGASCDYRSNFDPVHNSDFLGGLVEISCPVQVSSRSYQTFIVELWSRRQRPNTAFFGIETW